MSDPLRVVLADDSVLLREGLARLLEESGFEVAGQSGDAEDLLRKVGAHHPDVAVVDVRMPPSHTDEGLRAAHQIRVDHPDVGVLVLSQYVEEAYALELLSESTERTGYLLKDRVADIDTFTDAVRRVAGGGSALDPEVVALLLGRRRREDPLEALTPREREVLGLMAEGRSNAAIAGELVVTERAVEKHVTSIFTKLDLTPAAEDHRRVLAVLRYLQSLLVKRLPVLALLAVLAGSFAFHAYRAEHPTSSYQSADERAYGRLAVGIADKQTYGNGLGDALHWPPGGPMLFAAGQALFPDAASAKTFDIPSAYWLQAIVSLGTALAAFTIAALLAGAWAGVAAAALVGFYPPLILATGEQLTEPFGAFWVTLAFALFAVAARFEQGVGVRARRAGARRGGAHARGPAAGAVRARAAGGGVDVAGGAQPQARAARRRAHPRRRAARDGAVERLRLAARGRARPGHARVELGAVRRHLPARQRDDGGDEALARRGGEAPQPEAPRARRLRPRGALGARGGRRPPPGPGVQPRGRAGGAQEHLALRPGGPGRLREDDAQQGPADVVALRARRRAPHHLDDPRPAHRARPARARRAAASASCAAARCCWRASSPPR